MPVENLRTYPVYFPGGEPEGYWEMLQRVGPKPLIEPGKLRSEADWIAAGREVFEQADQLHLRTLAPDLIERARNPKQFEGRVPLPDGTVSDLRWVPTAKGVSLSLPNCRSCHLQYLADGSTIVGAPTFDPPSIGRAGLRGRSGLVRPLQTTMGSVTGAPPFLMGDDAFGLWLYQAYAVPWHENDANERLKSMTESEYNQWINSAVRGGGVPRWNGSPFHPAKFPDLIGIRDRKYIDHTATHLHRGVGDLMRYVALVSFAEASDFGPHHVLLPGTKRGNSRLSDEALYALSLYIYSLRPPANPNRFDDQALAGQRIFTREGCPACHTPPLYTNNKVTLATGFTPAGKPPAELDVSMLSVGTDPGLALATRKGTGYYKVPSLKGLWYRGHYLHDGAAASLEELFAPDRLLESHKPGGWAPPGVDKRAIKGHEFGLHLPDAEREALIAFLRTL